VASQVKAKQERIVEALRLGLDGERAVGFVRENGYAMTTRGMNRHLGALGGSEQVLRLIGEGFSNDQVLQRCLPEDEELQAKVIPPNQPALFEEEEPEPTTVPLRKPRSIAFEHTKLTLNMPNDLYAAIKMAAYAEGKTRTQLVVDILTHTLSRLPGPLSASDMPVRRAQNE